jgi:flavorubredoxin
LPKLVSRIIVVHNRAVKLPQEEAMPAVEIRKNAYWIGVNDRTTDLFEGIWPIEEEGVSYNSYLILDKKKTPEY